MTDETPHQFDFHNMPLTPAQETVALLKEIRDILAEPKKAAEAAEAQAVEAKKAALAALNAKANTPVTTAPKRK